MDKIDLKSKFKALYKPSAKEITEVEGPTIQRVHDYTSNRSALRGKHHEIHLGDVRKAAPGKWKTIIPQPME